MQRKHRLYCASRLKPEIMLVLDAPESHYLNHVLRLGQGSIIYLFNEKDGEWRAEIIASGKRQMKLQLHSQSRPAANEIGPTLCFAPIRRQRLELLIEKSVELGVQIFQPVITAHSNAPMLKPERGRKLIIEAIAQCDRLCPPQILPPISFDSLLDSICYENPMLFFREQGHAIPAPIWFAQSAQKDEADGICSSRNARILIGPEGGFSDGEIAKLEKLPNVTALSLGEIILRSETAAMAAIILWHSFSGIFAISDNLADDNVFCPSRILSLTNLPFVTDNPRLIAIVCLCF